MPRRTFILVLVFFLIFYLFENSYLKESNKIFDNMENNITSLKEELLDEKKQNLINQYQFDDYLDYHLEYSKVLFRDLYHFKKEITIYKGKLAHIKNNNLVINQNGLVGVVSKVNKNKSIVQLLTNDHTSLSVKVGNYYGILKYKNNNLVIEGIDNKSDIKIGDKVYTSDLSIHPEHILVGMISDIHYDKYEIEQILTVTPAVDFNNLSYLAVITDLRGET